VAALEDAITRFGKPDIFNTDQGSQFTSFAFINTLKDAGMQRFFRRTSTSYTWIPKLI